MNAVTFADVADQTVSFSRERESDALVLELIDTPWVQRLRDISQTANTRLVYMFSEHSRFGHSLGVAHLACSLMEKLAGHFPEISEYRTAVAAAALLHDIGHIAPGSHTAFKTWFPNQPDSHELMAMKIIMEDPTLHGILTRIDKHLPDTIGLILSESKKVPPWTWEIISGGGWNVDRGNWCIVDSILAGVSYGRYNIPALTESIVLTPDRHLALRENRLDAMMHFALSRHAMYRQIYQHRVILATDTINQAIVSRARDIRESLPYSDPHMEIAIGASSPDKLPLSTVFAMREFWWKYHLFQWMNGGDKILQDLSARLINRNLFKTVRVSDVDDREAFLKEARLAVENAGFDPKYYLHEVSTHNMHSSDYKKSMLVQMDDGRTRHLSDAEPLFGAMAKESAVSKKSWLAMPREAKELLGRAR